MCVCEFAIFLHTDLTLIIVMLNRRGIELCSLISTYGSMPGDCLGFQRPAARSLSITRSFIQLMTVIYVSFTTMTVYFHLLTLARYLVIPLWTMSSVSDCSSKWMQPKIIYLYITRWWINIICPIEWRIAATVQQHNTDNNFTNT